MSKGKAKPKTPTTGAAPNAGAWEASLASTVISDEELRVVIHLLSPNKVEDILQLQTLGGAVETNVRQKFVYIDRDTLIAQGKEQGKGKEANSRTTFPEVFALLKTGEEPIPASTIARLLKVTILEHRDAVLAEREEQKMARSGQASKSPTKSVSPDKGKKDKKGGKKSPTKKPGEGGGNIDPDSEVPRGRCPLKKRGEEKEEPKKIDDYPEGGPDMYVLCVGFDQADLLKECRKTNVPVTALTRVGSDKYSDDGTFLEHVNNTYNNLKVVVTDEEVENEMLNRVNAHQPVIDTYWAEIHEQVTEVPLPAALADVGFEQLTLPQILLDSELKKDQDKMEDIKLALYQRVADKIYSIQSSYSKYQQYNKGMELVNVADLTEKNEDGSLVYPLDTRYYNKMISLLPYESVTPATVLNVIIEQVCQDQLEEKTEVKEEKEEPVMKHLGKMIQSLPLTFNQQTEFEGFMTLKREKEETDEQPVVLKDGDDIRIKSFHLKPNLYPLNDVNLLAHSICNKMLELPKTTTQILAKIQSLANETETFCGQLSHNNINKALRQFAFESADVTRGQPGIAPLKDPKEYFWDVELLLSAEGSGDPALDKLKTYALPPLKQKLDHYTYRSSYEKDALLQVLSEAFYEYPYCQRLYHRHEHAMLLVFHAGYNDTRHSTSEWKERVHSNIGFHYFMSRTKDKFSELIEALPPLTPAPVPSEATAPPTPVTPAAEDVESEPEFQIPPNRLENFKKRAEMKEEDKKERVPTGKKGKKSAEKSKTATTRKSSPSPKRKGSPAKSPKRSGPPSRQSSAKSVNKVDFDPVPLVPEPEMDIVLEEAAQGRNVFVGFNLPNQIFQAGGNVSHCHPADGSLVRVEKWGIEGSNPRSRISLLKDGHVMSLNYHLKSDMDLRQEKKEAEEKKKAAEAAAEAAEGAASQDDTASVDVKSQVSEKEEKSEIPLAKNVTFNMQFKSGLCMSFKKPALAGAAKSKIVQVVSEESGEEEKEEGVLPTPLSTLMTVSLPNGLVIEYCDKEEKEDYYAIRQTYEKKTLLKHKCEQTQAKACSEESSRLYLSNGSVVKHMKNGGTVILNPDGGYSIKHVPPPPPPAPTPETPAPENNEEGPVDTPKPVEPVPYIAWEVTKHGGEQEHIMSNGEVVQLKPLQCYSATDPESKEVMFTRIDSVLSVSRPDGTRIVDHTDGTRITTVTGQDGKTEYKIECVGYATVSFDTTESLSTTLFGNATKIVGEENKTFTIHDEDGSSFQATPHLNRANFASKSSFDNPMSAEHLNTIREKGKLTYSHFGVHQFKLEEKVCFEHTDIAGNIYNVSYDGNTVTENPDTHVIQHLDHYYKQCDVSGYDEIERLRKPPMRLFIIHSDETGTEIMDSPKCKAVFEAPNINPDVVKVEEDVENDEFAKANDCVLFRHTFLTPFYQSQGSKWIKQFDEGNIVPNGLVYDGNVKPAAQIMGGWEKRASSPVVDEPELPPAIHYNQIIEEQALDDYKRQLVTNGLSTHAKWVVEQELHSQKACFPDEREEEEKETAGTLLSRVGTSRSIQRTGDGVRSLWRSQSEQKLYQIATSDSDEDLYYESGEEADVPLPTTERLEKRRNTADSVTRKYSTAVSHNPFKMKMKLKKGIIPQAKWDDIMTEKMEMKMLRSDLRNFRVPAYFDSKFGRAFLDSLKDGPDMSSLSDKVPTDGVAEISLVISEKSLENGGKGESLSTSMILIDEGDLEGSNISLTNLGTTPRPGNPTPNVATGGSDVKVNENKTSPKRTSPATPLSTHREVPSPTLDKTIATPDHDLHSTTFGTSKPPSGTVKSLHIDAKGDVRKSKVKIPRSICGYKPGAEPNAQFLAKEESVRRGVKTSSVLAASRTKNIQDMRGFQVYPPEVSFGVLCPNGMYATTVTLKNVGIDSCRFQVKCPRNAHGVTVALHSETNFVAAGMSQKFDVCLSAPDVSEITHVSLDVDIIMEMEVFHLPVLATILPTQEYDERSRSGRLTRLPQNIKIIDVSSVVRSTSSAQNTRTLYKHKLVA